MWEVCNGTVRAGQRKEPHVAATDRSSLLREFLSRLSVCLYLVFVAGACALACDGAWKGVSPTTLCAIGLSLILVAIVLTLWSRFMIMCVALSFVGLVIDNVALVRLLATASYIVWALASAQVMFLMLCGLLIMKASPYMRGSKAGAAIMP